MKFTTNPEAKMNRMETRIAETMNRMKAGETYNWNTNIAPVAASIVRGVYFAGGPECLEARDASGKYLGSIPTSQVA